MISRSASVIKLLERRLAALMCVHKFSLNRVSQVLRARIGVVTLPLSKGGDRSVQLGIPSGPNRARRSRWAELHKLAMLGHLEVGMYTSSIATERSDIVAVEMVKRSL